MCETYMPGYDLMISNAYVVKELYRSHASDKDAVQYGFFTIIALLRNIHCQEATALGGMAGCRKREKCFISNNSVLFFSSSQPSFPSPSASLPHLPPAPLTLPWPAPPHPLPSSLPNRRPRLLLPSANLQPSTGQVPGPTQLFWGEAGEFNVGD